MLGYRQNLRPALGKLVRPHFKIKRETVHSWVVEHTLAFMRSWVQYKNKDKNLDDPTAPTARHMFLLSCRDLHSLKTVRSYCVQLELLKPSVTRHGATLLSFHASTKAHFAGRGTEAREVRYSLQLGPQLRKHKVAVLLPT